MKTLSEIILNNLLIEREYAICAKNEARRAELEIKIAELKEAIKIEKISGK